MQALEHDQNPKQGLRLRNERPPNQGKIRYENTLFFVFFPISTNNI